MARGRFITFEGGEGTGKSTQLRRLAERLTRTGVEVVATREPGGSPGAEALRTLLLTGEVGRWSPLTEALLMNAARADHLERTVLPALDRDATVLSDRFADSTRAYQGAAGGVEDDFLQQLEAGVVGRRPDLTLVFDLPVEEGLARAAGRGGGEARFEAKGLAFHQRLRDAYLAIAAAEPDRCRLIDASGSPDAVAERVWAAVAP